MLFEPRTVNLLLKTARDSNYCLTQWRALKNARNGEEVVSRPNKPNKFTSLCFIQPQLSLSCCCVTLSRGQFHQHFTYSFYARRSQKQKKIQLSHKYIFTLLGSLSIKAVRRTLMKLSPGVNFINMLNAKLLCAKMLWHSTSFSITIIRPTLSVHSTCMLCTS
jgi:hypothetical protein